jgi:hypothetical protein
MPSGSKPPVKQPLFTPKNILDFFDAPNKNVMIVADSAIFPFTRKLANEFGVDFDPQGSVVTAGKDSHRIVATDILSESSTIFTPTKGVTYKGIGLNLDPKNNYLYPLLRGDNNVYSMNENGNIVNEAPVIVAGYQVFSISVIKCRD